MAELADAQDLKSVEATPEVGQTKDLEQGSIPACTPACTSLPEIDDELAEIVASWPNLPKAIRTAITTIARSASAGV